jgi:hypothetical protein
MVFNVTFNNISAILWQSGLLVEETGVPGENHRPAASHWQTLSHKCCIKGYRSICPKSNLSQTNSSQLWSIFPSSNLSQLFSKWLYFFFSQNFKEMCVLITLGVETESQYCSFTILFFLFKGCYLHILLHTLIVIGVNSCSTDPNNNKIEK